MAHALAAAFEKAGRAAWQDCIDCLAALVKQRIPGETQLGELKWERLYSP
jgi:hypothetical protein